MRDCSHSLRIAQPIPEVLYLGLEQAYSCFGITLVAIETLFRMGGEGFGPPTFWVQSGSRSS